MLVTAAWATIDVMKLAKYYAVWTIDDANAAHIHGFAEPGKASASAFVTP
jgi:hypothetical protein